LRRRGSRTAASGSSGGLNGLGLFSSAAITRRTNWNMKPSIIKIGRTAVSRQLI
jgi:hypothetical protein